MTIRITDSRTAELEQQLAAELDNERANERHYLEFVKNPKDNTRPYGTLTEIRESIEILELKYAEAKTAADAERAKLPTADEARQIIAATITDVGEKRKTVMTAAVAVADAIRALEQAATAHTATIHDGIRKLRAAGIPADGAELDGEDIQLRRDTIQHGNTRLTAINDPITYEWAPTIEQYINNEVGPGEGATLNPERRPRHPGVPSQHPQRHPPKL
ncbi:hypothetical protein [Leucobacter sp.]